MELRECIDRVNFHEAAEGATYFREAPARAQAYEQLRQAALRFEERHGRDALLQELASAGPLLFDLAWVTGC